MFRGCGGKSIEETAVLVNLFVLQKKGDGAGRGFVRWPIGDRQESHQAQLAILVVKCSGLKHRQQRLPTMRRNL